MEKSERELELLRAMIAGEAKDEHHLLMHARGSAERGEEAWIIEFDIHDLEAFCGNNLLYTQKALESKGKEVTYRTLTSEDQALFDEAMAREVSEVLKSQALRAVKDHLEKEDAESSGRELPMRWLLTWKPMAKPEKPTGNEPSTVKSDGTAKAKARIVLIGYKHPDLVKKHATTGKAELQTAAPTMSRTGRSHLLQATALDEHTMESADAWSAFLQAENSEESRRLWTKGVPDIARALGITPGELMRVMGAIYGLTNAPRVFWLDADRRLRDWW